MGVDVIEVILCVQRIATTQTTFVSITDQNIGFWSDFDKTR